MAVRATKRNSFTPLPKTKLYVVTKPDSIRGIYDTWDKCRAAITGVRGVVFQSFGSREEAEAALAGKGKFLDPGTYAFVDGNHNGGVGIVLVEKADDVRITQISTTVHQVFRGTSIKDLESEGAIDESLRRLRNILGELAALYESLERLPQNSSATVVHDYQGVGAWLTGRWRINDPVVAEIVAACKRKIAERGLRLRFQYQPAHQSTFARADEFVEFNTMADRLATRAAAPAEVLTSSR